MAHPKLLRAKVEDQQGRPVANARVFLEEGPGPLPDIAALSDDRGEVRLSLPRTGRYRIGCAAEGFEGAHATLMAGDKPGEATVVIALKRAR